MTLSFPTRRSSDLTDGFGKFLPLRLARCLDKVRKSRTRLFLRGALECGEHRFELRLAEQRGTCRRQQRGHPIILAVFIEVAATPIIPWLDGIVAEHEDQQEPLVADIGNRVNCSQKLGEERKQAWMVAGTARK